MRGWSWLANIFLPPHPPLSAVLPGWFVGTLGERQDPVSWSGTSVPVCSNSESDPPATNPGRVPRNQTARKHSVLILDGSFRSLTKMYGVLDF